MTGDQVNGKLERGFLGKIEIKELKANPGWPAFEAPSDNTFAHGVADSVTEQAHQIDAAWDAVHKRLTLSLQPGGDGYWIPYLGNGPVHLQGVAVTADRGLGAYTPVVVAGGVSWVVTGPFSGCSSAVFSPNAGGRVFAHVITPTAGHTADTVAQQVANIAAQVVAPPPDQSDVQKVLGTTGLGYVFWTLVNAIWYRRVVYAFADKVTAVEAKTQI